MHLDDRVSPAHGGAGACRPHNRPLARHARAQLSLPGERAPHQPPPPLKKAAPPPPPPSPPPRAPPRLRALPMRLLELLVVLDAMGRATFSPAWRPLRMIVELLPARPVTTRRRSCLPFFMTVTAPPEIALVGTLTPSACLTTTSAVALIPGFNPVSIWSRRNVTS